MVRQSLEIDVPEATALFGALQARLPPSPRTAAVDAAWGKRRWSIAKATRNASFQYRSSR